MRNVQPTPFPKDSFVSSPTVIGQAIRAARTQAGIRVADAALLASVSLQTMVDIEAGSAGVSIGKVLQVADALGVSLFVVPASSRNVLRNQIDQIGGFPK